MYTASHSGSSVQWLQGLDGVSGLGHDSQAVTPDLTWTSFLANSVAKPHEMWQVHRWLIVVGKPDTTEIDYSPDGTAWRPLATHNGIAMAYIDEGWPAADAMVRLSNAQGIYAEGAPDGAGLGLHDVQAGTPTPTTP
jgi:hypothetical protein